MKTVLRNARVGGRPTAVTVEDGKIVSVTPEDVFATHAPRDNGEKTIDLAGKTLRAGLVDIHSHGCAGHDTMDGDALAEMARVYRAHGVTTWYPTTMTEAPEKIAAALAQDRDVPGGAYMPGFHVEGPYINEKYKGAQAAEYIVPPDVDAFLSYKTGALVTVAPEMPGALDFIRAVTKKGVRVALGHTDADYETCCAAFDAGAVCLTHTCNAMPPFLHRKPGPIGAAIDKNAYAQVIADGLHLARSMVVMLYRTFGPERMILISDSMQATGIGDGDYCFGGQAVHVRDGVARTESGALAGSTTDLFRIVKKAISFGIPADDAFRMASETPADMMGIPAGRIAPGYRADFLVLNENDDLLDVLTL